MHCSHLHVLCKMFNNAGILILITIAIKVIAVVSPASATNFTHTHIYMTFIIKLQFVLQIAEPNKLSLLSVG